LAHRVKGAVRGIVENGLVGANEGIAHPLLQRAARRGSKLRQPFKFNKLITLQEKTSVRSSNSVLCLRFSFLVSRFAFRLSPSLFALRFSLSAFPK
jgi:hypothetical protein